MPTNILGSYSFSNTPDVNGTLVLLANSNITVSSVTTLAGTLTTPAIDMTPGVVLTTPTTGGVEYDGVNLYFTNDLTSGRGLVPLEQRFKLTAAGATIGTTIANFFGTTSNISLVSGGYYEIEVIAYFLKTTNGTVTWTFTNPAPVSTLYNNITCASTFNSIVCAAKQFLLKKSI